MSIAEFEEVFKRGAEQIDDHDIVVALLARPYHPWYARSTHQRLVNPRFMLQWTRLLFHYRFQLDRHFFPCYFVHSVKDRPCPGKFHKITRKQNKKEGGDKPQPPIASSSSRRYLPPKVKSILLLGVETGENDKKGADDRDRLTYYTGSMLVVQIGVRVHPSVRAGILGKASEKRRKETVLMKYSLYSVWINPRT